MFLCVDTRNELTCSTVLGVGPLGRLRLKNMILISLQAIFKSIIAI